MITTTARVVAIADGMVQVESTAKSSCGSCHTRSSCGVSGLGKYFSGNRKLIPVTCDAQVCAGDELQMSMSEIDFLKAGVLVYLLPSSLTIVGAAVAATFDLGDVGAVAGAALGFGVGMLLVRIINWVPRMAVHKT
jgi:sigma-E factor negative regulatory protein RseC